MVAYLLTAIMDFFVAGFVFSRSRKPSSVAFSLLAAGGGFWSLELFFLTYIKDPAVLAPLFHVSRVGMFFIAPLLLTYVTLITHTPMKRWIRLVTALSYALSILLSVLNNTILPSELLPNANRYTPVVDLIAVLHRCNFLSAGVIATLIAALAYRRAIFTEKLRIRWITVGAVLGTFFGLLSFEYSKLIAGTAGNLLCLACFAYAASQHRLRSVTAAMNTGTIKVMVGLSLAAAYFLIVEANMRLGPAGSEGMLLQLLALGAMMEAYPRLSRYFIRRRGSDPAKGGYSYDFTSGRLQKALKLAQTPRAFAAVCDDLLLRVVRVESYSLHLIPRLLGDGGDGLRLFEPGVTRAEGTVSLSPVGDGAFLARLFREEETVFYDEAEPHFKGQFARLGASALVPLRVEEEPIGFILLGAPGKEEQFSYDDIRLLNWFGREAGPVLENILAMVRLEASLDEAEKTLSVVSRLNEYNHDIKTPFSNIEALLLAGDAFSPEERQARILDQVRKGHALVSTMTGLLKGRHRRRLEPYDLNEVIERVVASFPTKAALVETDLKPLPHLEGFADEMELVFSNLLSNAFAAQDKLRHRVRVWSWVDEAAGRVGCCVEDNGCGIAEGRLAALWHGQETTRRSSGGTGVGLSVVRRVVEAHGGTLVVTSEEGVGTEFTFSLPIPQKVADIRSAAVRRAAEGGTLRG